jgi:hypothetical protein
MCAEEPDHDDPASVVHQADQSIVVFDIEDHPTAFENAGSDDSHLLGRLNFVVSDCTPSIVLRSGCLTPFMAGSCFEIALDEVSTDYNHGQKAYRLVPENGTNPSKFWKRA